jgi:hypothetical protein
MACCTTIPPLNSTGQKRSSGGIFDLPKSAKRRRPFGSTSVTTINSPHVASALTNSPPSSKFLTSSIIDANDENNKKKSVFQTNSLSRSCFTSNTNNLESYSSPFAHHQQQQQQQQQQNFNDHQQFEFKNELMERIKHEAKRLIKRKQAPNLSTVNTGSTSNNSTDEEETLLSSSSPSIITTSTSSLLSASAAASIAKTASSSSSSLSPQTINDGLQANKLLTSSNLIRIPSNTSIITKTLSTSNLPQTTTSLSPSTTSLKRANEINNINTNNSRLNLASVNTKINHNDLPLFSMNQVNQICSGMIREREQFIREQYDKILAEKLSEQYDSFVKFTHEQIQRRFEKSQCSYVS